MDTGIIDKSVFQPENWAQAPKPLNSDIEGAIKEAMMEPGSPVVKTEPSSPKAASGPTSPVTELTSITEGFNIN